MDVQRLSCHPFLRALDGRLWCGGVVEPETGQAKAADRSTFIPVGAFPGGDGSDHRSFRIRISLGWQPRVSETAIDETC